MPDSQLEGSWASSGLRENPRCLQSPCRGLKTTTEVLCLPVCLAQSPSPCQALPNLTQFSHSEGALTLGRGSSGSLDGQGTTLLPFTVTHRLAIGWLFLLSLHSPGL